MMPNGENLKAMTIKESLKPHPSEPMEWFASPNSVQPWIMEFMHHRGKRSFAVLLDNRVFVGFAQDMDLIELKTSENYELDFTIHKLGEVRHRSLIHERSNRNDFAGRPTDSILSELRQLKDGWSGPDSVAPSGRVRSDVTLALLFMGLSEEALPEFEIDDRGFVTFLWLNEDDVWSMDFSGDGKASCTFTSKDPLLSAFKSIDVDDVVALCEFVNQVKLKNTESDAS